MTGKGLRPLVAGNWKMNGTLAMASELADEIRGRRATAGNFGADLLVCPPFPFLCKVRDVVSGSPVWLGAQDCHGADAGAHTGDVSAAMLADTGCSHVILGHSERRADHGESSSQVAAKARAAHAHGLKAIICVGETEGQRNAGDAMKIVEHQLIGSIPSGIFGADFVIAYEPVWAIGTGRVPSVSDIAAMHLHIRRLLASRVNGGDGVRILYGGSVKPANALELMSVPEVNGALVGGASLKAGDFWAIAEGAASAAGGRA